jgi:NAD(P)-dependent dehydrogenase (short-subunit alcohol dehydrogenase family)
MQMTAQQKRAITFGAVGLGALLIAQQAWRRRDAYAFAGKSVVITGGSRGLGLVLARHLAAEGARLTLLARDNAELARAADSLRTINREVNVLTVVADIRLRHDAERAIAEAVAHHGGVDVLINNAGTIQVGPLDHMKLSDYDDAMNTHFWGPLYMIVAALPHMRRQGEGRIVNISSIGGRVGLPHLVPYSASKFALTGLSDSLRYELARDNIAVTTVCPGLMRTGSPLNASMKGRHPQEYAWFAISDSLPLTAIDVERAARQVVAACRRGDAELVITLQAKLAILARTVAPELFAGAMAMINRLLPPPTGSDGDTARLGRESESEWAPSRLTESTYKAAEENNEM